MQLSAIGLAIPQAVNVSQILTTSGYATELRESPTSAADSDLRAPKGAGSLAQRPGWEHCACCRESFRPGNACRLTSSSAAGLGSCRALVHVCVLHLMQP